jgi:FtsP/CotA-like multicopper oxidase with cupredoxin domain
MSIPTAAETAETAETGSSILHEHELAEPQTGRDTWMVFGVVFAGMCLLASIFAWGMASRAESEAKTIRAGGSQVAAGAANVTPMVHLSEFKIEPSAITASAGGTLQVMNVGSMTHNLSVEGTNLATSMIAPGGTAELKLTGLAPGTYTVYCQVSGHRDSGMHAQLQLAAAGSGTPVAGSSASAAGPGTMAMSGAGGAADGSANSQMTPTQAAAMDAAMAKSTKAFPAKTAGLGAQPLAPTVLADGTKQFVLTAQIVKWEVSPGKLVDAWTYNGTVPGPTIHVNIGDKVNVVLHNKLPESTVIHFHGLEVPFAEDGVPYITQNPVEPGADFTYSFVAKGPAVGMYHSHFDAANQVTNGMAGALLVGDEPLPAQVTVPLGQVQQQIFMLDDSGTLGLSINGKSFPATAPIVARQGDWLEVQYFNEGNMIHPIHLHGMPQLVIAKDGYPAPPQLMDTVLVAPGERYTVLVHATDVGVWAWHCHILTHAENNTGMFGMVTALVVKGAGQ